MKLRCEQIAASHGSAERLVVLSFQGDDRIVLRNHVVRMHEIEVRAGFDSIEQRRWLPDDDLVPTHVRHFVGRRDLKADDLTRDYTQPLVFSVFVADFE